MKMILLYIECIICKTELFDFLDKIVRNSAGFVAQPQSADNFLENIKNLIESRESQRLKNNSLFKPLNEMDYSKSQRISKSYV